MSYYVVTNDTFEEVDSNNNSSRKNNNNHDEIQLQSNYFTLDHHHHTNIPTTPTNNKSPYNIEIIPLAHKRKKKRLKRSKHVYVEQPLITIRIKKQNKTKQT